MIGDRRASEWGRLRQEMRACRRCLDAGHAITPGAIQSGPPTATVMLIGQAPGVTETEARRPFNAGSGRRLFQWLGEAGWDEEAFRACHVMTAVTKCYPGKSTNGKGDRVPSRAEQALCRPFLEREIRLIRPRLIIPVGGLAIGRFFPGSVRLADVIGTAVYFPSSALDPPACFDLTMAAPGRVYEPGRPPDGRWLVPLPHPSGASLWPNRPQNRARIEYAVAILGRIRQEWELD